MIVTVMTVTGQQYMYHSNLKLKSLVFQDAFQVFSFGFEQQATWDFKPPPVADLRSIFCLRSRYSVESLLSSGIANTLWTLSSVDVQ